MDREVMGDGAFGHGRESAGRTDDGVTAAVMGVSTGENAGHAAVFGQYGPGFTEMARILRQTTPY